MVQNDAAEAWETRESAFSSQLADVTPEYGAI